MAFPNFFKKLKASHEDLDMSLYHSATDSDEINNLANNPEYEQIVMKLKKKLLDIVLGDNRAETNWGGDNFGKNTKAIGTEVHRSNFAPGADDKKLDTSASRIPAPKTL